MREIGDFVKLSALLEIWVIRLNATSINQVIKVRRRQWESQPRGKRTIEVDEEDG